MHRLDMRSQKRTSDGFQPNILEIPAGYVGKVKHSTEMAGRKFRRNEFEQTASLYFIFAFYILLHLNVKSNF